MLTQSEAPITESPGHARTAVVNAREGFRNARFARDAVISEAVKVCNWNGLDAAATARTLDISRRRARKELGVRYRWLTPLRGPDPIGQLIAACWQASPLQISVRK
jgi:cell wall-associated NlpC family hydrolase